jgi:hypothetical protein
MAAIRRAAPRRPRPPLLAAADADADSCLSKFPAAALLHVVPAGRGSLPAEGLLAPPEILWPPQQTKATRAGPPAELRTGPAAELRTGQATGQSYAPGRGQSYARRAAGRAGHWVGGRATHRASYRAEQRAGPRPELRAGLKAKPRAPGRRQ